MDTTPHLFDSVELVVALPEEPYAGAIPRQNGTGSCPVTGERW